MYEINGRKYSQKKLVFGQIIALMACLEGVQIRSMSAPGLLAAFGSRLPDALAVVLIPEGCPSLADRDIAAISSDVSATEVEVVLEVVTDFFAYNQPSLLLEKIGALVEMVTSATASTESSASLPTAT
jgi:hypothetical protein